MKSEYAQHRAVQLVDAAELEAAYARIAELKAEWYEKGKRDGREEVKAILRDLIVEEKEK